MSPKHLSESVRDEEIAAFLEGSLDASRRDALAARIAGDPQARLLLLETSRFQDEVPAHIVPETVAKAPDETPAARDRSLRARRTRIAAWASVLAASLLLALNVPFSRPRSFDSDWVGVLSRSTDAHVLVPHLRGADANVFGFASVDAPDSRSFRDGVATVDLAIIQRSGAKVSPGMLDEVRRALASAPPDRHHFELGRWVEASRIAAAAGDVSFFRTADFQDALQTARGEEWSEETRLELERVVSACASEELDLRQLEAAFDQILRLY